VDAPTVLADRFPECPGKRLDATSGGKDRMAVIASVNDVIKPARFRQTKFSWHKFS
jgi:hypothetical protein